MGMRMREVMELVRGMAASDGAGVKLTRSLGARPGLRFDPFLMLDEFASDDAADYIGGFPSHPHRGFQTVTYMLDGHMRHQDHMGNTGHLRAGDVQWMIAGRGIIHSEMPEQSEGRMRGFQLWINLPAAEKMQPPAYRDLPSDQIPAGPLPNGGQIKMIAGTEAGLTGPIMGLSMEPLFADVHLPAGAEQTHVIDTSNNVAVYVHEGSLKIGGKTLDKQQLALLGAGDAVQIQAGEAGVSYLLLAGKPIGEPVVQYGPFVMNTREEIDQALQDYAAGTLATQAA